MKIAAVGPVPDLTYPVEVLGAGPQTLKEIAEERHSFAQVLKAAQRPMLILGMGALARLDGQAVLALAARIAAETGMIIKGRGEDEPGWNGFNVLHNAAARVAGLDLGLIPGAGGLDAAGMRDAARSGRLDLIYLLHADEWPDGSLGNAFVIYQGTHGDKGAHRADVILPGAAYTEKDATWVNTEGRVQLGLKAVFPPGDAREDWKILRALSEVLGRKLDYDNIESLRARMRAANTAFSAIGYAPGSDTVSDFDLSLVGEAGTVMDVPFELPIKDYFLTNPIARASATMAECSALHLAGQGVTRVA